MDMLQFPPVMPKIRIYKQVVLNRTPLPELYGTVLFIALYFHHMYTTATMRQCKHPTFC